MPENRKIRICMWGTKGPFFDNHIRLLESIESITILSIGSWHRTKSYDIIAFNNAESPIEKIFEILKRPFRVILLFSKLDKWCDVHIVHYMNLWYLLSLFVVPLKKPVIYIPYGTDWRYGNKNRGRINYIRKLIFKYVVHKKIDLVVLEFHFNLRRFAEILELRDIEKLSLYTIFPVRNSFYKPTDYPIKKSSSCFLIFSPRALRPFYNHDILIDIISMSKFRNSIVLLFINSFGHNNKYVENIASKAKNLNIKVSIINRFLSADEMARLFSISEFNVNIPVDDQFGMSIMEGALLCSIPILNKHVKSYRELMGQKNAIFIDPYSIEEASKLIDSILANRKLHKKMCRINRKIFRNRKESNVVENLTEVIFKVIER
ncbi:hypothetical protein A3L14_00450 [Thermococcus thioreducens]|uniref:Glycosyltransferase involved in cell wall bisynthesis n=2 Tax=Thermococcus thioreducens TaxID=277988 RepID=A0A0Q2MUQ7_9EURY|nr:hypothetical protein A3L14_00450 [Thermococcus thioreducens]KQH83463.1 hypothetical protein AMR53_00455 [Thermococcus thioreducens]SEW06561.1 Glycosyltransferase involved in cell wall bisynthesis [Thermococcus thioreducens]